MVHNIVIIHNYIIHRKGSKRKVRFLCDNIISDKKVGNIYNLVFSIAEIKNQQDFLGNYKKLFLPLLNFIY